MTLVHLRAFPSLDNYGTGMMGLVAASRLARMIDGPLTFVSDFDRGIDLDEVRQEAGLDDPRVRLERFELGRPDHALDRAALMVGLGGDTISEYYRTSTVGKFKALLRWARRVPTVLLGHSIGPFSTRNALVGAVLLRPITIVSRDRWTTDYLRRRLWLSARVIQGADLAFDDLPLQHAPGLERETLERFGLQPDGYATLVVSGMQSESYYTSDRAAYLGAHAAMVERLAQLPAMAGRRVVLLAHTFGRFGDEPANIAELLPILGPAVRERVVPVVERILPTRARFILGRGLLTLSGRMHPAVSTFQMGRPAITLAYSRKYEGVIGTMLGRGDLIVEANDPGLWSSGAIVDRAIERAAMALERHDALCREIAAAVAEQKRLVDRAFERVGAMIRRPHA